MEQYRHLARVHNTRLYPLFYVDITFADVLFNQRMEHVQLTLNDGKLPAALVAKSYDGSNNYERASFKHTVYTAVRISQLVIDIIDQMAYHENPQLCLAKESLSVIGTNKAEQLKALADCQPYSRFLHTS